MKRLNNKLSPVLYFLLVIVFCSCTKVKLHQEVTPAKVCDGTMYVSTSVWTYKWYGAHNTLEYRKQKCVKKNIVDSTKISEYNKALPTFIKVKNCY